MRSNPPLFLSSSVVERSAVNRLVVGSNPTWGDLIHSELTNSGLTLTVKGRELSVFFVSISSYPILFCEICK